MTQIAIQTQIEAINRATEKALKSKESALKLLLDAGILKAEKSVRSFKIRNQKF